MRDSHGMEYDPEEWKQCVPYVFWRLHRAWSGVVRTTNMSRKWKPYSRVFCSDGDRLTARLVEDFCMPFATSWIINWKNEPKWEEQ